MLMRWGVTFDDSNQIISNIELVGLKKKFLVESSIVSISVFIPRKSRSLCIRWRRVFIESFSPPNKIAFCYHTTCIWYHRAGWFACIASMQLRSKDILNYFQLCYLIQSMPGCTFNRIFFKYLKYVIEIS